MIWLALGSLLLAAAAFGRGRSTLELPRILALVALLALAAASLRVYPPTRAAAGLGIGTAAAAALRFAWDPAPGRQWLRWWALALGLCAGLFALFGPAGGIF